MFLLIAIDIIIAIILIVFIEFMIPSIPKEIQPELKDLELNNDELWKRCNEPNNINAQELGINKEKIKVEHGLEVLTEGAKLD